MVLVSEDTVNRTWDDRGKGDKGAKGKQPWQGKCWRCDKRVTWRKIVKFPVSILAANVETVGTWKSVVVRNRINRAKEEAIADVEGNLEENDITILRPMKYVDRTCKLASKKRTGHA